MSTAFLGTSDFAAAVLGRLAASDAHRPSLVLSRPDRPRGRGRKLAAPPVAERARELGIALEQPETVNDSRIVALIAASGASAVVVCAFGALIKEPLLSAQELINVHPSLLPRWRGAAPIERAIMAGDSETGVSIMRLTAGLDSGPVYRSGREAILAGDTYGSLSARLEALSGALLLDVLDHRAQGTEPQPDEQDERGVTYAEKIGSEDRLLDPARTAVELERVVRALSPHIGARVALPDGVLLGVREATVFDSPSLSQDSGPAGAGSGEESSPRLIEHDGRLLLACREGALELRRVQPPGGRPMDASSYLRGHGAPGRR